MIHNHNWDVCPKWVRFSSDRDTRCDRFEESECPHHEEQKHVHEFLGSTKLAEEEEEDVHNHRFAGVSGEAICTPNGSHKHKICTRTDFFDHFHEIEDFTGPAIDVGNGKHVHFDKGVTTEEDGHVHKFEFATLIESPLLPKHHC